MIDRRVKPGMVRWYNPAQLFRTGVDLFVSEAFHARADTGLLEAQSGPEPSFSEDGLWFDYMADTGDGFRTTHAMAKLLSRPELSLSGRTLPRGAFLVLGGDAVYPVASRDAYERRLKAPFDEAGEGESLEPAPHVYAIPGNHDWYDGLISFLRLFTGGSRGTEGRRLGIWRTRQTRSYFSIRLPKGWWLWGFDIDLEGDVDEPQREFFAKMMRKLSPGDRIIACTPAPDWILEDDSPDPDLPGRLELLREGIESSGASVPLQLSGDFHNYQRFDSNRRPGFHKIISGGGGAFLHPTHRFGSLVSPAYDRVRVYPPSAKSFALSLRCLLFPFLNPSFSLASAALYLVFGWPVLRTETFSDFVRQGGSSVFIAVLIVLACSFYAYDQKGFRFWGGVPHGLAHVAAAYAACRFVVDSVGRPEALGGDFGLALLGVAFAGALVTPVILGVYLFLSLNLFGFHPNEAFSALRIQRYKNFLRLHIGDDGTLTVYSVGLEDPGGEPHLVDETVL